MSGRRRADIVLVERGFFESRARARAAIEAGLVTADGNAVRKPSDLLDGTAAIEASRPHPYVSRGGVKLAAALDAFAISPEGAACLDIGSSTGGFTDVLLKRGAKLVHAVDVGRDQMHPSLRADPRVVLHEGLDIRRADEILPASAFDLVCIDVSFISLTLILPPLVQYLSKTSQLVVLVKPQFEVGRAGLGRGGIVRDESLRDEAVVRIDALVERLGWRRAGHIPSPITGGDGNVEYLIGATRG